MGEVDDFHLQDLPPGLQHPLSFNDIFFNGKIVDDNLTHERHRQGLRISYLPGSIQGS